MGRLFSVLVISVLLLAAGLLLAEGAAPEPAQAVFFRMIFPQLMPFADKEATPGEASVRADEAMGEAVLL